MTTGRRRPDPSTTVRPSPVLPAGEWSARREAHRRRVDHLIGGYLDARRSGARHPVIDFLFTYYSSRPSHLLRWDPGYGVVLADAGDDPEFAGRRGYHTTPDGLTVDAAYLDKRHTDVERAVALADATAGRPARLGCFGMHEWAMVYHSDRPRHDLPLRLGGAGTDAVVESMPLRCTHFDAFRFFTPDAVGRNERPLSRAAQIDSEQPGCLHATMDLYRTCFTLAPLLPSDLTFAAFALALTARELDMRASPYDLRHLGYRPVPVETPEGRAAYVREQSAIAERGADLRAAILAACRELLDVAAASRTRPAPPRDTEGRTGRHRVPSGSRVLPG